MDAQLKRNSTKNMASNELDELRNLALENLDEDPYFGEFEKMIAKPQSDLIFGLNPVERMFLSIGLFLVTMVGSIFMLLVTGSIAIP